MLIGQIEGVEFCVEAWSPAEADTELSCACMFEREAPGATMSGGLLHLDQALDGALSALRRDGQFRAEEMETISFDRPPRRFMVVGLGDPTTLTPSRLERAACAAFREAARQRVRTVAFAPDLLDAGLPPVAGAGAAMLQGVVRAIRTENRLVALGLTAAPNVERWTFDAGPQHLAEAAAEFRAALTALI